MMCPIIEMCGPVACVGVFLVNTAKSRQSHASRMTRESTLPGRRIIVSVPANSASRTSNRLSSTPGSMTLAPFLTGSRTSLISPSPEDRPVLTRVDSHSPSAALKIWRIRPADVPFRDLAVAAAAR